MILEGASDAALWQVGRVLRDSFGYSLRRHGAEPGLGDPFWARIVDSHPRICFMRSHLTEGVRRRLCGLDETSGRHQNRLTEMALMALGATVLVVESESKRSELPHSWQRFEGAAVADQYRPERLWATDGGRSHLAHTHANLSALVQGTAPGERLVDIVTTTRLFQEKYALRLPPPSLGIGSPAPKVVIVGDAPAPSPCYLETMGDHPDVPFSRGPAAETLWNVLDSLEFHWWQSYVTNASTFTKHTPWTFGEILGWRLPLHETAGWCVEKIVCLGRRAESVVRGQFGEEPWQRLVERGVIGMFAHPSHGRIYRYREISRLRDELGIFLADFCRGDAA